MTKVDPIDLREQLVGDAVADMSNKGGIPDMKAASDYIVEILHGMDRKKAAAKDPVPGLSRSDGEEMIAEAYERKTGRKAPKIERDMDQSGTVITGEQLNKGLMGRLIERMRIIKCNPEMYHNIKHLILGLNHRDKNKRLRAAHKIFAMLDATDKIVGYTWRKPPPPKLMFT